MSPSRGVLEVIMIVWLYSQSNHLLTDLFGKKVEAVRLQKTKEGLEKWRRGRIDLRLVGVTDGGRGLLLQAVIIHTRRVAREHEGQSPVVVLQYAQEEDLAPQALLA